MKTDIEQEAAFFRILMETIPDRIYFKDTRSRYLRVSDSIARLFHLEKAADAVDRNDFDFFDEADAQRMFDDEQGILESEEPILDKVGSQTLPDGGTVWTLTTKVPLRDDAGNVIGTCGISKDITDLRKMEEELEQERDRLSAANAELKEKKRQLENDLRMARGIQQALLPNDYPRFSSGKPERAGLEFAHRYLPATSVGGDYFNIVALSPEKAGVFICDIMGHGLRAALVTVIIRGLLDELRSSMNEPGEFLSILNGRLRSILEAADEPFIATAFYMVVDLPMSEVRFSSAGHPPTLFLPGDSGRVETLGEADSPQGPALGLFDEATFPSASRTLAPKDRILLITDGLFEVESPAGEQLGLSGLQELIQRHASLPPDELLSAVIEGVCQYSGRQDFDDDVCVVGVECRANVFGPDTPTSV